MKNNNYIPTVVVYTKLLNIASLRFSLSLDERRNKYGLFTNKQWINLLNN